MKNGDVIPGVNDFESSNPDLAKEWDSNKNAPITPSQVSKGSNKKVWWICSQGHSFEATIKNRNLNGTKCPYCTGKAVLTGFNDLATVNPTLAAEWDFELNDPLTPQQVLAGSHSKAHWRCSRGHRTYAVIKSRNAGRGCAVCAGKAVDIGFNDLASNNPDLAKEWDYEKNAPLSPREVVGGSNKKVWWICPKGHSFESIINDRNKGIGCHYCSNLRVLEGFNDLVTTNPDLASEWDIEKNAPLKPVEVIAGSPKNVWWICPLGHSYRASLNNRKSGMGCGVCDNKTVLAGFNDLATTNPDLAREWDYFKNKTLTPQDVTAGSQNKAWWICPSGHSYYSSIGGRNAGNNCPICSNKSVLVGFNDLATTNPSLAEEWDYEKNAPLTPKQITSGSPQKIWWICPRGHSYRSSLGNRNSGLNCAYCSGKAVLAGFNDLATINPELASEWDFEKNYPLTPQDVTSGSPKKVWWKCPNGHSYFTLVKSRHGKSTGCPNCSNSGYDTTREGIFYFIQHSEWQASKVGVTNTGRNNDRVSAWKNAGWTIIKTFKSEDGLLILNLETNLLRWIRKDLGLPPYLSAEDMSQLGGWTETFASDGVSEGQVLLRIETELNRLLEKQNPLA